MTADERNVTTSYSVNLQKRKYERQNLKYYPKWFPINNHFLIHQRQPTPSIWGCLKSTCERNSEMACVWSHLVAFVITATAFHCFLKLPEEYFLHELEEKFVISFSFIGTCTCCLLSTLFHTFYHHSEPAFEWSLKIDLCGIVAGVKGPWIAWLYYSFYCEPLFRDFYMVIVLLNAVCGVWFVTRSHLLREGKTKDRLRVLISVFSLCLPGYLRIFYRDGLLSAMNSGHGWALLGFCFAGIGIYVFATKIPESWYSEKYDNVINSHVIFHIAATMCMWSVTMMLWSLREQRLIIGDTCPRS
ncbi:adiponectin receptor protein 1-like [Styela clava]|uniref:adiponectin receptor protein 1-like n=1 Tax=Styela clava TaxID=7725 RepID=UPI001939840C|nr:adiponectin receptor protein 1-like [Styela clava]